MHVNEIKNILTNYFCNDLKKSLLIITGPTGVGKSKFAVKLAEIMNGVIINADSIQVYKNLDIISSQPKNEDKKKIKHYLYGFRNIEQNFSVGLWVKELKKTLRLISISNKLPILVGGSGLYLNAVCKGLSEIPNINSQIKNNTRDLLKENGINFLKSKIKQIDYSFFKKNSDRQRIIRAFEVYSATGKNMTFWHTKKKKIIKNRKIFIISINCDRKIIYERCEKRFDLFLKNGALREIKLIWDKKIDRNLSSMKSVGVKWLLEFYDGKISLQNAINLSKRDTRRYVKRQNTWFKNNLNINMEIIL